MAASEWSAAPPAWRDTARPVRLYGFDARLVLFLTVWVFFPGWWTSALVAAAVFGFWTAERRGYRFGAALRGLRARAAGPRRALHAMRPRRFVDFG